MFKRRFYIYFLPDYAPFWSFKYFVLQRPVVSSPGVWCPASTKWCRVTWIRFGKSKLSFFFKPYMSHIMKKPAFAICEQQRRRSACTSAQSDQHLCCSIWVLPGRKPRRQVFSWRGSYSTFQNLSGAWTCSSVKILSYCLSIIEKNLLKEIEDLTLVVIS